MTQPAFVWNEDRKSEVLELANALARRDETRVRQWVSEDAVPQVFAALDQLRASSLVEMPETFTGAEVWHYADATPEFEITVVFAAPEKGELALTLFFTGSEMTLYDLDVA